MIRVDEFNLCFEEFPVYEHCFLSINDVLSFISLFVRVCLYSFILSFMSLLITFILPYIHSSYLIFLFLEWSVLYLSVVIFGIAMSLIGLTWALCFCFSRYVVLWTFISQSANFVRFQRCITFCIPSRLQGVFRMKSSRSMPLEHNN